MLKNKNIQHVVELNLAMMCMASSGMFGHYIEVPVPLTIALRSVIGGIFIYLFCRYKHLNLSIKPGDRKTILLSGILMGAHWITYFLALRYSNIAIGMLSLLTYPVITALLEPLMLKTKFYIAPVFLGILVLVGMYYLVPVFDINNNYTKALGFGLISASCYAIRNIIMKAKISNYHASALMLYQLVIITVCLSPLFFILDTSGIPRELPQLLTLGIVTTAIGHTGFVYSFRYFTPTSVSIMSGLQPIYGILIGIIFMSQYPEPRALIGGAIILMAVVLEGVRSGRK